MGTDAHFQRVKTLLQGTKSSIVIGGETDEAQKYIAPTIVQNATTEDSLMGEEIFGPILTIIAVKDIDEAIAIINSKYEGPTFSEPTLELTPSEEIILWRFTVSRLIRQSSRKVI